MTALLEKAFQEATKLPQEEQEAFARWILKELESEHHWAELLDTSASLLDELADEAHDEYRTGKSAPLDPDRL